MTEEEAKGLRAGDRVLIPATISKITSSGFTAQSACGIFLLHHLDIHSVLPRPLEVGDRVKNTKCTVVPADYEGGEILAISGGWAMVLFPGNGGRPGVGLITEYERVSQ